jgi:acetyl esterase/lipase
MRTLTMVSLLLIVGLIAAARPADPPVIETDITYIKRGETELKLDLYRPAGKGPFPLIVWIHGGGWHGGSKADYRTPAKGFTELGWAGAAVQYRLAPGSKFPAQIHDVKTAIRFLRSKAAEYQIDPDRLAAVGASAGGHLALLAGFTGPDAGLEGDGYNDQSSAVKAVVNYFGPVDLRNYPINDAEFRKHIAVGMDKLLEGVVGTADPKSEAIAKFSPILYIKKGVAPVFTVHGTLDPLVPFQQAELLRDALRKAEVPEVLHVVEKGDHGGWSGETYQKALKEILPFLDKHVRGEKK